MSNASEPKRCPKCGGPIPAEAPQGLCPRCLLAEASIPTEAGTSSKSLPPTLEQLAVAFPQLEILEFIGQGGMGFVFKARQPKLDRFVALKILPQSLAADPAFAERFTREGRLLARLNHPNIVTVHDFGQANGFFYLLMEFVDGVNLRQAMKAGRFTSAQALAVVPKICEALEYAHGEGILHRDIKPENILLDTKGRVKIADFGIAKLIDESRAEALLTATDAKLGTPHYMAPEQIEKPSEVDHRADIYSLGVVFYEMLTGELPLGRFAPPSEKSSTDPRLDDVVLRTLAKEPSRRTQTAREVKTQVDTIAQTPPPSIPSQPPHKTTDRFWRRFAFAAALVLLAMVLVLIIAFWLYITRVTQTPEITLRKPEQSATKTIVLTGATNQLIGAASNETRIVSVHTGSSLLPGETLTASGKLPDGQSATINPMLFITAGPKGVSTSAYFSWFLPASFGDADVESALTQLSQNIIDRPLTLTNAEPLLLFSLSNRFGAPYEAHLEFKHSLPAPPVRINGTSAPVQARVHIRSYTGYFPSLTYTVKLPAGYQLHATANEGQASTSISELQGKMEYRSTWMTPYRSIPPPGRIRKDPSGPLDQKSSLEKQFEDLYDEGPFQVILGQPKTVFSLTNDNGEVFEGKLELVGPLDIKTNVYTPLIQPRIAAPSQSLPMPPQHISQPVLTYPRPEPHLSVPHRSLRLPPPPSLNSASKTNQ